MERVNARHDGRDNTIDAHGKTYCTERQIVQPENEDYQPYAMLQLK